MSDDRDSNEYTTDDNNYNVIINGNTVHHTIRQDDIKITVSIETTENQLSESTKDEHTKEKTSKED
jgi:type 1 glutamine amidotransferase